MNDRTILLALTSACLCSTHNDAGNETVLFAIAGTGSLVARVRVTGAALIDWQDVEAAPCGDGNCL